MLLVFVVLFVLAVALALFFYVRLQEARDVLHGIFCNADLDGSVPEAFWTLSSIRVACGSALGGAFDAAARMLSREEVIDRYARRQAETAAAVGGASFVLAMRWLHAGLRCRRASWRKGVHLRQTKEEFGRRLVMSNAHGINLITGEDRLAFSADDIAAMDWRPCDEHGEEVGRAAE